MQPSPTHPSHAQPAWLSAVVIRRAVFTDLARMEWEGQYQHFRNVYAEAYRRARDGLSVLWVADLPEVGLIGQVFIQFICDRLELADGVDRAYLYGFRIRPTYRDAGLGSRMMEMVEEDLRSRCFRFLTLNVAKDNFRAIRLYTQKGYHIVAHEPGIWSYPDHNGEWQTVEEPAWRMEKKL